MNSLMLAAALAPQLVAVQSVQFGGLKAHDIQGVRLDMTVREVAAMAGGRLESIGAGQFKAHIGAIDYDLGFSPLGHLYRIDSVQVLGRFEPDGRFGRDLAAKLIKKFGPLNENGLPTGPASVGFLEQYIANDGQRLNRETESLSAMLGGGFGQPIKLQMKLMDFRILRRDSAALNANPQSRAQDAVRF